MDAMPLIPAVFFDRDGVLNHSVIREGKPYPPASVDELVVDECAVDELNRLKTLGFVLVCVTNQPDVARGTTPKAHVEAINAALKAALPLDALLVCWHDDKDDCACRKPKAGMLEEAAQVHAIDCQNSFMIGDRWKDIEAGKSVGCQTIWIDHGYDEKKPDSPTHTAASLREACRLINR